MPKMKTIEDAAKRFEDGHRQAAARAVHAPAPVEKKPSTRTRRLTGYVDVHPGDRKRVKRLLAER